ncbi:MAG TPA: TonB-dependent siderophore receptor [Rhodanobacteraceae bacterium]|nr:TonB-dependent siderophore receptor [Rhodanobacteraceae bacterium]
MKRTALFLALFPCLTAFAATDKPLADPQHATELGTVKVAARADKHADDAAVASYGNADPANTPASVRVLDRAQLDDRHVRDLSELARLDASLGDNYAPVGYYQTLAIRGYPLDYATGFRQNNLGITGEQRVALENKQRVEVLKGLAGLAAGVMEPGGVINYVSKRAADVRTLTLGTDVHGSRYAALDVGAWLTPDFGLRANLAWEDTYAWVRHADGRRNFYSLAADWQLSPNATLELDADYQATAQRSVSGYQLLGGDSVPSHVDRSQLLGFQPWQQPVGIHAWNTSARYAWDINPDWTLRLAAGRSHSVIDDNVAFAYGCFYTAACADGSHPGNYFAPNGDYDIYDFRSPDDTRVTDNAKAVLEGRFDTGSVAHELTVGVTAFHRSVHRRPYVYDYVGSANIGDTEPPVFAPSPNQPGPMVRRLDSWQRTLSLLDRMHLGADWQLLLGGQRVAINERAWDSDAVPERHTRRNKTLPQAALMWQPQDGVTAYASYGEGLSLGKEAPYWTSNGGATLGPRLSRQLEFGAKWQLRPTLDLGAALYRIHQPYQFAAPDASEAGYTFVERGEEVHSGLELTADGRITEALGVHASVALIRAEAEHTGSPVIEGHQVVNVPRWRSSVQLDYQLDGVPGLHLLGGWRHAASNPATPDGRVRVEAYDVFDAGFRYGRSWHGHDMTWRLGIDNLFNRFYWRDTGSSGGDSYLFPGAPRMARLSVTIDLQ